MKPIIITDDSIGVFVPVIQTAFNEGVTLKDFPERIVFIPRDEYMKAKDINDVLHLVFHNGQNEIDPQERYSVSVGDIIKVPLETAGPTFKYSWHVVSPVGFKEIDPYEFLKNKTKR